MSQTYSMCRSARSEWDPKGIVVDCARTNHRCDSPREPVWFRSWVYRDGERIEFYSRAGHCGSCVSDEEYYGSYSDDDCCCVHREEHSQAEKAVA